MTLLVLSEARAIGEAGLPTKFMSVDLTCFPRATDPRYTDVNKERHRVLLYYAIPPQCLTCPVSQSRTHNAACSPQVDTDRPQGLGINRLAPTGSTTITLLDLPSPLETMALFSHSSFPTLALVGAAVVSHSPTFMKPFPYMRRIVQVQSIGIHSRIIV